MRPLSAEALLANVVDYAGLFPPAALSMPEAVAEYHAAKAGRDAWMLGRFVVPAARLGELAAVLGSTTAPAAPWRLSALARAGSDADCAAIAAFNGRDARPRAVVDAVESKPDAPQRVDWLARTYGQRFEVYVEVAPDPDMDEWLGRIAALGLRAKVRTGGVTPDAFPAASALATFLEATVRYGVPFKATAGLHHALCGRYPLTYEPGAPVAPMFGYLGLLLAAAALCDGQPTDDVEALLRASDPAALRFDDDAVRSGGIVVPTPVLRDARARCLVSFGSCSFREPVAELAALTAAAGSSPR